MALISRLAGQLGRPTGRVGRFVARVLNRSNRSANVRAVEHDDGMLFASAGPSPLSA
jgi:hypothetical protein